jgi:hypothetical protein
MNRDNLGEYITSKVKLFNMNFGFHHNKNKSTRITNRLIAMPDKNVRINNTKYFTLVIYAAL